MPYEYPDRPPNRPDPIMEDGHKAPDARKQNRAYIPAAFALAVAAVLAIAAIATLTSIESQEQVERGEAAK